MILPKISAKAVDGRAQLTPEYYNALAALQQAVAALQEAAGTPAEPEALSVVQAALEAISGYGFTVRVDDGQWETRLFQDSATIGWDNPDGIEGDPEAGVIDGSITTAKLADDGVTNPKLANMATKTIKARKTGSAGDPEDCTVSEVLDFVPGTAAVGDLIVRDASAFARIAAGTAGYVLTSNGPGALPSYQAAAGGGSSDIRDFWLMG